MRDLVRRSAAAAIVLALVVASIGAARPTDTAAHAIPGFEQFLYALSQVESGGRYTALNRSSGAYGKYQIIPSSWRAWARQVLGNPNAPKTPANQEKVARAKINQAIHKFGSWRVVAYWWLTGRSTRNEARWTAFATRYVNKVMRIYNRTATPPADVARYQESYPHITWAGSWGSANHGRYAGDTVRWAEEPGASATFPFIGTSVAWIGPKGPTRGQANVYVDGALVKTVDLKARRFQAVNTLFKASWAESGVHTLVIEVVGTKGRPTVAIDEFLVGK